MGLNGMNLGLVTTSFGNEVNFFDSQVMRWITGGATVDNTKVSSVYQITENNVIRRIVPAGTPYAKLANGKYCPVKSTVLTTAVLTTDTIINVQSAKNFQPGDAILVGTTAATVAANGVDYVANKITLTAAAGAAVANSLEVKAVDGGDAYLLVTDNADVSFGDCAVTGVDEARVLTARLPYPITSFIKSDLNGITFR
jgi:hypothetical protein